jgi:catechol-2,3-dioxygenase
MALYLDHIVVSVKNLSQSVKFYEKFLGKVKRTQVDAAWVVGNTKLFLTSAYKKQAKPFDKHNFGLNHIAFGIKSKKELEALELKLTKANVKHSSIIKDKFSGNSFLWFDDPDKIRLEFYLRK